MAAPALSLPRFRGAALDPALARELTWGEPGLLVRGGDDPDEAWERPPFRSLRIGWSGLRSLHVVRGGVRLHFRDRRIPQALELPARLGLPLRHMERFEDYAQALLYDARRFAPHAHFRFEAYPLDATRERLHWNAHAFRCRELGEVPWDQLRACVPQDEWPTIALTWREDGRERFRYLGAKPDVVLGEEIEQFVAELARRAPKVLTARGWWLRPELAFRRVDRFPAPGRAGYRIPSRTIREIVETLGGLAVMRQRLRARVSRLLERERPIERHQIFPVELRLHRDLLFARDALDGIFAIDREAFHEVKDESLVFGRRGQLRWPAQGEVVRALTR